MNIKKITLSALLSFSAIAFAQQEQKTTTKAWELGVGGNLINYNRVAVTGFQKTSEDGYLYNLEARHLMGGVNLYLARELNPWLYLDAQANIGLPKKFEGEKQKFLYNAGLGVQLRLSPLFKSQFVEPYFRGGLHYIKKDFSVVYKGKFDNDITDEAHWKSTDVWNPNGRKGDKNAFVAASLGAGVNAWLSNSVGLGLQGEYYLPIEKDLPRFAQVTGRIIFRFGGAKKKSTDTLTITKEVPVEKIVEVEKKVYIEKEPEKAQQICNLLNNVNFEFDKAVLTEESQNILDNVANVLAHYPTDKFLITGFTDARGSSAYNLALSERRAKAVAEALIQKGVSSDRLKYRGVGKRATSVTADKPNDVRLGDRKVTIER